MLTVPTRRFLTLMVLCSLMVASLPFASAYTAPSPPIVDPPMAGDAQVSLSWNVSSDGGSPIMGYYIYRSTSAGQETFFANTIGASNHSYIDTGLTNGLTYYYYVTAVNDAGESAPSSEVSCTPMGLPGKPTALIAVGGNGSIYLSWTAPYDNGGVALTHYRIYRGTSSGAEIFLVNVTETHYTDSGLSLGRTYYYMVSAVTSFAEGNRSDEVSALLSNVPGQVTTLVATSGNGTIQLNWSAPGFTGGSTITGYQIYRSTVPGAETFLANTAGPTFIDANLTNGQTYYYKVTASNLAGTGPLSSEVSATPRSAPGTPLDVHASPADRSVVLTWSLPAHNGGTAILHYRIYRGTAAGAEIFLANTTALEYTDTGLTNGRAYYYRVTAVNALGEGPRSLEVTATPLTVPGQPSTLTVTPGPGRIELAWSAPADPTTTVTGYKIYRGTAGGQTVFLTTVGKVLTFVDSSLPDLTTYYYRVAAVNSVGEGPLSVEVHATTYGVPSEPLLLDATAGEGEVLLTWEPPANDGGVSITAYKVYRSTEPGNETYLTTVTEASCLDEGLMNGVDYYYRVSAVNSLGEGPLSAEVHDQPAELPTAPVALSATPSSQRVSLSWNAPTDDGGSPVTSYRIYRSTASGAEVLLTSVAGTAYLDPGLTNGQRYFYKVSAINAIGEGSLSSEASAIPATVPGKPVSLVAEGGLRQVTLTWSAPGNGGATINGYNVYRNMSPSGNGLVPVAIGVGSPFTDTGLADFTTYYYKVTAVNSVGEGPRSDQASATSIATPSAPLGMTATAGDRSIALSWEAAASGDGSPVTYRIYRSTTSGQESFLTTVSGTSYTDNAVANGQTYFYKVSAVNSTGESAPSSEKSATLMTEPEVPIDLVAVAGDTLVTLSWTAPSNSGGATIRSYRLYWSTSQSGGFTSIEVTGTSYLHYNLDNGQTYYYKVSAVNDLGEGEALDMVSATPQARLATPLQLSADGQDGQVLLTWTAPQDAGSSRILGYKIYRGNSSGAEVYYAASATTSYLDDNVTNGQTYYYKVSAINVTADSKLSSEVSATPEAESADFMSLLGKVWLEVLIIVIALLAVIAAVFLMIKKGIISIGKGPK